MSAPTPAAAPVPTVASVNEDIKKLRKSIKKALHPKVVASAEPTGHAAEKAARENVKQLRAQLRTLHDARAKL
jgi:hypothetical protein